MTEQATTEQIAEILKREQATAAKSPYQRATPLRSQRLQRDLRVSLGISVIAAVAGGAGLWYYAQQFRTPAWQDFDDGRAISAEVQRFVNQCLIRITVPERRQILAQDVHCMEGKNTDRMPMTGEMPVGGGRQVPTRTIVPQEKKP